MADIKADRADLISKDLEFVKETVLDMHTDIKEISTTLKDNTLSLQEHMRRTEIAEIRIDDVVTTTKELSTRLKPLEDASIEHRGAKKTLILIWNVSTKVGGGLAILYSIFHGLGYLP